LDGESRLQGFQLGVDDVHEVVEVLYHGPSPIGPVRLGMAGVVASDVRTFPSPRETDEIATGNSRLGNVFLTLFG
jgi:hypothetical protein